MSCTCSLHWVKCGLTGYSQQYRSLVFQISGGTSGLSSKSTSSSLGVIRGSDPSLLYVRFFSWTMDVTSGNECLLGSTSSFSVFLLLQQKRQREINITSFKIKFQRDSTHLFIHSTNVSRCHPCTQRLKIRDCPWLEVASNLIEARFGPVERYSVKKHDGGLLMHRWLEKSPESLCLPRNFLDIWKRYSRQSHTGRINETHSKQVWFINEANQILVLRTVRPAMVQ